VTTVVVEASEAWPVVAAGLGSALIVSLITLWVARKQRGADAVRLDQQLTHDRTMREQQLQAASGRLDRQLGHDRDMRDLQYLRETLAPIVSRAIDWDAWISLHKELATSGDQPADEWKQIFAPLAQTVADTNEQLRRDGRTLVIVAGTHAPVALRLREVANDGDALVHLTRQRAEAGRTTPEIQHALDVLLQKYGHNHARFVEAANEAVRWSEAESSAR
jgi:hypothetical protein